MITEDNAKLHTVLVKGWVRKGDKFLIAKRSPKEIHAAGIWSIPGGKIEDEVERDIIENTLKKEILEEVGVEIGDRIEFVGSSSFQRVDAPHVVGLTFLCGYQSGEARPLEDTTDVKWLTLEELKKFKELPDFLRMDLAQLEQHIHFRSI
ncbi:MAG: NUDIX domain-containing protein [Candidatus Doudnabacteria bacterium]|nr:NUDIX domain-containing protein [Candidatus Doudnabacteria bacterium]